MPENMKGLAKTNTTEQGDTCAALRVVLIGLYLHLPVASMSIWRAFMVSTVLVYCGPPSQSTCSVCIKWERTSNAIPATNCKVMYTSNGLLCRSGMLLRRYVHFGVVKLVLWSREFRQINIHFTLPRVFTCPRSWCLESRFEHSVATFFPKHLTILRLAQQRTSSLPDHCTNKNTSCELLLQNSIPP